MEYLTIWSFLGTAGGTALLTHFFSRNKMLAETDNLVSKTYGDILENLRQEVSRLTAKMHDLEKRELLLRAHIRELETEIDHLKNAA
ncbi:MAG: hypothetical protein U0X71_04750 [Sphingobacteriaceae bacterium]|jgi:hypothetical protein